MVGWGVPGQADDVREQRRTTGAAQRLHSPRAGRGRGTSRAADPAESPSPPRRVRRRGRGCCLCLPGPCARAACRGARLVGSCGGTERAAEDPCHSSSCLLMTSCGVGAANGWDRALWCDVTSCATPMRVPLPRLLSARHGAARIKASRTAGVFLGRTHGGALRRHGRTLGRWPC